jgi:hypothetical protein
MIKSLTARVRMAINRMLLQAAEWVRLTQPDPLQFVSSIYACFGGTEVCSAVCKFDLCMLCMSCFAQTKRSFLLALCGAKSGARYL